MPVRLLILLFTASMLLACSATQRADAEEPAPNNEETTPRVEEPAPEVEEPLRAEDEPTTVVEDGVLDGASLYAEHCEGCHGNADTPGMGAPNLIARDWSSAEAREAARETVIAGRAGPWGGNMPAFGDHLTDAQIDAILDWLAE